MDPSVPDTIRQFLIENFSYRMPDGDLDESQSLIALGVLDSIAVLSLVTFLEDAFGIAVDDDDVTPENLDTIANLAAFVARKRGQFQIGA